MERAILDQRVAASRQNNAWMWWWHGQPGSPVASSDGRHERAWTLRGSNCAGGFSGIRDRPGLSLGIAAIAERERKQNQRELAQLVSAADASKPATGAINISVFAAGLENEIERTLMTVSWTIHQDHCRWSESSDHAIFGIGGSLQRLLMANRNISTGRQELGALRTDADNPATGGYRPEYGIAGGRYELERQDGNAHSEEGSSLLGSRS